MPLKRNKSGHFTICNTQLSSYSRQRIGTGITCTCDELLKLEQDRLDSLRNNPNTFMGYSTSAIPKGSYGWVNVNRNVSTGPFHSSAAPNFSMAQHFYDAVQEDIKPPEPKVKYRKDITYYEIIERALDRVNQAIEDGQSFKPAYYRSDLWEIFEYYYDTGIETCRVKGIDLSHMTRPTTKVLKIGIDIPQVRLESQGFVVKPLKSEGHFDYRGRILTRESYWVITGLDDNFQDIRPPLYLYEFPMQQGFNPKTDLVLLIDPYEPSDDALVECVFKGYGVSIMKKFDINNARKLLATRKSLFDGAPTATNTILLFQLMDAIILNDFKTGMLDLDKTGEKNLIRLEKLKNLALGTKFNEERKSAVDKSFLQFEIIASKKEEKVG